MWFIVVFPSYGKEEKIDTLKGSQREMDPASVYDLLFISDSADEHHNRVLTSIHFRSERGYPGSGGDLSNVISLQIVNSQ